MDERTALEAGTILDFPGMECTVGAYVGRGSNAIVYTGSYPDGQLPDLRHRVLIKELFPYHARGRIFRGKDREICFAPEEEAMMELHTLSFQRGNEVHIRLLSEHPQDFDSNINTFSLNHTLYTVLGFSGGRSLDKEMKTAGFSNLPLTVHVRRLLGILDVLEGFHSAGFLHLDISPDNILLIGDGRKERMTLIDYNSVHTLQEIQNGEAVYYSIKEGYTAPEVGSGKISHIGYPSDLYALTAVFYRCLTEKDLTAMQVIRGLPMDFSGGKCLQDMPETVRDMVRRILKKGLSPVPGRRYQNTMQMRTDLEELQDRIEGKGITHWALWETGRLSAVQIVSGNHALNYIKDGEKLYPVVGETEAGEIVSIDNLVNHMLSTEGNGALLVGSGGAGKTTALLRVAYMQKKEYSPASPAVIYLSLYGFAEKHPSFLKDRILENLKFKAETDSMDTARHELIRLLSSPMHTKSGDRPQLLLLLDGLNEVGCSSELLLKEIESLAQLPGVRILITSRSEEAAVVFPRLYLRPLPEYLWEGKVNAEIINTIRPNGNTISVLELTGAEIREMQAAGYDRNQNGKPYEYLLFTRNDMELEDDTVYRLAIATAELQEDRKEMARETEISPEKAIADYVTELGTFGAEDIVWK